ncbi:class I SAM-dependent methyltransferase [Herbaspirillum sp. WKF16]|uniref:class I SAM-dependent methyltransferase n=1 Tax=Herbaspirillum sp. WKF16 TaxID=3028312 RepID=UPI0023A9F735|nr:class I SAM-dependent methyltransferase [Herbaspirillum sp. WKF16]WDZ96597.1 class I SAM-dependent methyltransferase [Herbaspirillum sp. WKF16]
MSVDNQLKKIEELYTSNLQRLGTSSQSVGWNSEDSQKMRFIKLAQVVQDPDQPFSVNDYGCGYGAMANFFEDELGLQIAGYNGYDISKEMLSSASAALSPRQKNLQLIESPDITTEADYSFVSGTFNVRFDAERAAWTSYVEQKIAQMDRFSRRGFAFNMLTSYVDWEEPHLYYGNPCDWFDFCKKNFSKRVSLIHDYPLWEWTIVVRK